MGRNSVKRMPVDESWLRLADAIHRAAHRRYEQKLKKFACDDRRVELVLLSERCEVARCLRAGDARGAVRAAVSAEDIARESLFDAEFWEIGVAAGHVRRIGGGTLPVTYQPIGFL